jgi:hypothetical protein
MTDSPDEYGELLRRALSAEADSVVPSPDGLEIIRARIERRGLRRLTWWRAGASVAGAVLVAASVVMVVPGLREQVVQQITFSGDVKPATVAPTDVSGTSRPLPPKNGQLPPAVTRSDAPPPPAPAESRRTTPSPPPQASPDPTRESTPTPTPTCPTVTAEAAPAECAETATPVPTHSEPATPSESPCPVDGCQQVEEPQPEPPLPSEQVTPTPIGG